jgi:RNA polymerase sigma-70 factor (ECF subfamily)
MKIDHQQGNVGELVMLTQAVTGRREQSVHDVMLDAIPSLRAFAIALSGKVDRADDLVQETLLRAMANIGSFQAATNMSAWLTTILRNLFRSEYRKRRYEVQDSDGLHFDSLIVPPEQHSKLEFDEFREALARLSPDQREALLLVRACGFSYEEAATICESPVGTIKSRVNRARSHLSKLLDRQLDPARAPISVIGSEADIGGKLDFVAL